MRNDLIHQSTEYDCGPTCLVNALRRLFDRAEIPPGIIHRIWLMGNDACCAEGREGCRGTSRAAMRYMADWLREYGKTGGFPVDAAYLSGEDAVVAPGSRAWAWLQEGGCAVMRCFAGKIPHYVLLTALLPEGEVGLFDPYAETPVFREPGRRIVAGEPKKMNRAVRFSLLNREDTADYAMGETAARELVLIRRTDGKHSQT